MRFLRYSSRDEILNDKSLSKEESSILLKNFGKHKSINEFLDDEFVSVGESLVLFRNFIHNELYDSFKSQFYFERDSYKLKILADEPFLKSEPIDELFLREEVPNILNNLNKRHIDNCIMRELMIGRGYQCVWKVTIKRDKNGIFKTFYRRTTENEMCYGDCLQGFKINCDYYNPVIYLKENKIITFEDIIKRKQEFKKSKNNPINN